MAEAVKPAIGLIECLTAVTASQVRQRGADYVGKVRGILGGISGVSAEVRGSAGLRGQPAANRRRSAGVVHVSIFLRPCRGLQAYLGGRTGRGPQRLAERPAPSSWRRGGSGRRRSMEPRPSINFRPCLHRRRLLRSARRHTGRRHGKAFWPASSPLRALPGVLPGAELLYVILAPTQATLSQLPLHLERRERKRDHTWGKPQPARLTTEMIAMLPDPEDRWALSLLHAHSTYRHASLGLPLFHDAADRRQLLEAPAGRTGDAEAVCDRTRAIAAGTGERAAVDPLRR